MQEAGENIFRGAARAGVLRDIAINPSGRPKRHRRSLARFFVQMFFHVECTSANPVTARVFWQVVHFFIFFMRTPTPP